MIANIVDDITIRKAQTRDIPDILRLNRELNDVNCGTPESMKESLEKNKNELVFVAIYNDKAVGFICGQLYSSICYTSMQCEITELVVSQNYRRKGVAGKLIRHLEQAFSKNNVHEIIVVTGVRNQAAQQG